MVRDAIVFRCKHTKAREECLDLADELTLEKAVEIGCNHETNLNSLKRLTKDEGQTVNIVNKERSQTRSRRKRSKKGTNRQDTEKKSSEGKERPDKKDKCGRCGYHNTLRNCPAMGQQRSFCKKDESLFQAL